MHFPRSIFVRFRYTSVVLGGLALLRMAPGCGSDADTPASGAASSSVATGGAGGGSTGASGSSSSASATGTGGASTTGGSSIGGASNTGGGGNAGAAGGAGGNASGGSGGSAPLDAGRPDGATGAFDLEMTTIAVYQAVQVNVMKGGQEVTALNAPLVKGRPALLRVFVRPGPQWTPRSVTAQLVLAGGNKMQSATITAPSMDGDLAGTFNFELSAQETDVDSLTYSVVLTDGAGGKEVRWPASGTSSMAFKSSGASIKIVFVPLRYQVGGADILPDTSPAAMKTMTDAMFAVYPTPKIDATVHAPVPYNGPAITSQSAAGWAQGLSAVSMLRRQEAPATNVFYYGLVAPSATPQGFCGSPCTGVTGIAYVPASPTSSPSFVAIGVSYHEPVPGRAVVKDMAVRTGLQEVAHMFGRYHAPCGPGLFDGGMLPQGIDPNYPYKTGSIGVWGYDLLSKKMVDPGEYVDIQTYCDPVWISDYTYRAAFDFVSRVNAGAPTMEPAQAAPPDASPSAYRFFRID